MPTRPINPQRRRPHRLNKAIPANLTGTAAQGQIRTADEVANTLQAYRSAAGLGLSIPLPRDAYPYAFGPGEPAPPSPINPLRSDTGRPEPRLYEYAQSWNLPGTGGRMIPWRVLREAADLPILSDCIRIRKEEISTIKWEIGVARHAVDTVTEATPGTSRKTARAKLKEDLKSEIRRVTEFWKEPDRENGLTFPQWSSAFLDERLVIDACAVYPHYSRGGDLLGLNLIDGTTIKPLLDGRGGRPQPPYPAYQQQIYGFPRGEFTADISPDADGHEIVEGGYRADQLLYFRHTVRTWTPYGRSPVEMSLLDLDTWMKRTGWLRSEYTEGVVPSGWIMNRQSQPAAWTPQQVFEYESSLNDAYGGDVGGRRRVRMLPPGWEPEIQADIGEKFKPDYDLHLLKLLVAHFDMTIHELGFTETQGLGSAGHAVGQQQLNDRKGSAPTLKDVAQIFTQISHKVLGMPNDLEFRFTELAEDDADSDDVVIAQVAGGMMTLNEGRDELGRPRYAFPEADMAAIIAPRTGAITFIDGSSIPPEPDQPPAVGANPAAVPATDTRGTHEAPPGAGKNPPTPPAPTDKPPKARVQPGASAGSAEARKLARAEVDQYRSWARKGRRGGRFHLVHLLDPDDLVKYRINLADVTYRKADEPDPKGGWPEWEAGQNVAQHWAGELHANTRAVVDTAALAQAWVTARPRQHRDRGETAQWIDADVLADALTWLGAFGAAALHDGLPIGDDLTGMRTDGYLLGLAGASEVIGVPGPDLTEWAPGDTAAAIDAITALGPNAREGLQQALNAGGASVVSVTRTRYRTLASALAESLQGGYDVDETKAALDSVNDDPAWADRVAVTEVTHATSLGAAAVYDRGPVEYVKWITDPFSNVCAVCLANEAQGPIRAGQLFASGDQFPPAHPNCACAVLPANAPHIHPGPRTAH